VIHQPTGEALGMPADKNNAALKGRNDEVSRGAKLVPKPV
jgi:hypothetical protein